MYSTNLKAISFEMVLYYDPITDSISNAFQIYLSLNKEKNSVNGGC